MFRFTLSAPLSAGLFSTVTALCVSWSATAGATEAWENDPLVVTATRDQRPAGRVLAHATVITRDDLDRSQAADLLEILRLEAGLDVTRTGGPGGQTGVFMRGTNSNHVLVLIDGVRVAAAGTGAFAWETLDPTIIERIEIVRGPQAARWGSDALGGVIQIFTRQIDGARARVAYGRYRDRSLSGGIGDQQGSTPFSLAVGLRRVGGFSAQNERGFAFDPDDDGHENASVALGGAIHGENQQLDWRLRGSLGSSEFDDGELDFENHGAHLNWRLDGRHATNQLSLAAARDKLESATPFGTSEFNTRRVQAGWQQSRALGADATWLVGADSWRESAHSLGNFSDSRWNAGAWTGLDGRHRQFDYQGSVRADRDQHFGTALTGELAGGIRPGDNLRLHASVGRGFRAPTFNQLFSPGFGGAFAGNPDLDPETSLSVELGLAWQPLAGHQVRLNAWENRIDDLIDFAGENFQAININEARIRGVELAWDVRGEHWRAGVNGTWQDPEDRDSGEQLLRRAKRKANATLDWLPRPGSWVGMEVVHVGARPDVGAVTLPAHTLFNLRAGWMLSDSLRLEGRVENLADRDYQPADGFNAPGRAAFLAIAWMH